MTERDKLKISDVLTELSGQFCRDVSLSLVQREFIIRFVGPDIRKCAAAEWEEVALSDEHVCVFLPVPHQG